MEESNSNAIGDPASGIDKHLLSSSEVKKICSKISGAKGETCYAQLEGTEKTKYTEEQLFSYWKSVSKGYKKTIDEFFKRKDTLSKILGLATSVGSGLSGLITPVSNQGTDYAKTPITTSPEEEKKTMSKTSKIMLASTVALALVALVLATTSALG
jgi:hypothetical protein